MKRKSKEQKEDEMESGRTGGRSLLSPSSSVMEMKRPEETNSKWLPSPEKSKQIHLVERRPAASVLGGDGRVLHQTTERHGEAQSG